MEWLEPESSVSQSLSPQCNVSFSISDFSDIGSLPFSFMSLAKGLQVFFIVSNNQHLISLILGPVLQTHNTIPKIIIMKRS